MRGTYGFKETTQLGQQSSSAVMKVLLLVLLISIGCINADFPTENDVSSSAEHHQLLTGGQGNRNASPTQLLHMDRRVVNGIEAVQDDWKFLVALLKSNVNGNLRSRFTAGPDVRMWQACGGSLITPLYALTAGHCVVDSKNNLLSPEGMVVRVGAFKLSEASDDSNVDDVEVEKIFLHDNFNVNFLQQGNDLAILKLKRPVNPSKTIKVAKLPPSGLVFPEGTECYSAGWGLTEKGSASDLPLVVDIPVVNSDYCYTIWGMPKDARDGRFVCALGPDQGDKTQDTCGGDSGGPLVCKMPPSKDKSSDSDDRDQDGFDEVLAGAVSFGTSKCGTPGMPAAYTSLSFHRAWIESIVGKLDY